MTIFAGSQALPPRCRLKIKIVAIAVWLVAGFVASLTTAAQAQTDAKAPPSIEGMAQERAKRLAEEKVPRTATPLDPKAFDKFVGVYQLDRYNFFAVTREGSPTVVFEATGGAAAVADLPTNR